MRVYMIQMFYGESHLETYQILSNKNKRAMLLVKVGMK